MNLKEDIGAAVDVTVMIMIGETETMVEMGVVEEGGEGDGVVITEAGTIDRHIGIGMTGNRSPPDDICGMGEADREVLHREVPDMAIFHGGINEPGVLPVQTHVDP